jgi:2-C-methyl-D-erythritol 4-phosphate cytidylyltransferase
MIVAGVVLTTGDGIESARLDGATLIDHAASALRGSGVVDVVSVVERSRLSAVDGADVLVLHDAHRPLAPAALVVAVVAAVRAGADAAVPVIEVNETVEEVDAGRIVRTVPRESLLQVQFPRAVRAGAVDPERLIAVGARVVTVAGAADAFPVRDEHDLQLAAAVLAVRRPGVARPA